MRNMIFLRGGGDLGRYDHKNSLKRQQNVYVMSDWKFKVLRN